MFDQKSRARRFFGTYGIFAGLVFAGLAIYGIRSYRDQPNPPDVAATRDDSGNWAIEPAFFREHFATPHAERMGSSLYSLWVFVDFSVSCPIYFQETPAWVEPLWESDPGEYELWIVIPAQTQMEHLNAFLGAYGVEHRRVIRLSETDPLNTLFRMGVFKAFVDSQTNLIWCEQGSVDSANVSQIPALVTGKTEEGQLE
jgi:hypothetical protein